VYLPAAEAAAEAGLDYLAVHARHAKQKSRDEPTWAALKEVAALVGRGAGKLKVIGNGDVNSAEDVSRMLEETGVDGVMVGRAAMRNPWALRRLCGGGGEGGERPTAEELERGIQEYQEWAGSRPATERYRTFHKENFARLRKEIRR
jgi:tRNA-dihydrouridine synthase